MTSALRWGWVVSTTPRLLYPRERPGTHCTGGWVGHRAGLDGHGKSRLHRDSIPGPSSPYWVAIPTELSRLMPNFMATTKYTLCVFIHAIYAAYAAPTELLLSHFNEVGCRAVHMAPADPVPLRGAPKLKNTKICCGSFRTGLRSYRKQYSVSLLWYLELTSLIITGGSILSIRRKRGRGGRPVV